MKLDIRDHPEVVETINAALMNGKIVEIHNEAFRNNAVNLVVVEIHRLVRTKPKKKD